MIRLIMNWMHLLKDPPHKSRRIFVNRDLRLDTIDMIGFDMDYTLAVYQKESMETLAHRLTVDKLVQKRHYPEAIKQLPYDPQFVIRGLIVDKHLGNIFKIDRFGHVGRCYHGRRMMNKDERRHTYRKEHLQLKHDRFAMVDTLFALPEMCLYADLVDFFERQEEFKSHRPSFEKLFYDIRESIDEAHRDESLKSQILQAPSDYLHKDKDLAETLHKLRSSGKKLFLLTNSHWPYTEKLMQYLLDNELSAYPSWQQYFDYIIVGANKPAWFTGQAPFVSCLETKEHRTHVAQLQRNHPYTGGNMRDFEHMTSVMGEKILYIGDHIYGDILKTKKSGLWRTALILSELEEEIRLSEDYKKERAEVHALEEKQRLIDQELLHSKNRIHALEEIICGLNEHDTSVKSEEHTRLLNYLNTLRQERDDMKQAINHTLNQAETLLTRVENMFNPYWGRIFKEGHENTRFGAQVSDYACIYTSRVTNFLHYSPFQYFRAPRTLMPHER